MISLTEYFLPQTTEQAKKEQAKRGIVSCFFLMGFIAFLNLCWLLTGDLEISTAIGSAVFCLLLTGALFLIKKGKRQA